MVIKAKQISFLVYLSILGSPIIWLLGVGVVYYHVISFLCFGFEFAFSIKHPNQERFLIHNNITKILIIYILIYTIALGFGVLEHAPKDRILSSAYNLSYWIMYLFIISFVSNYSDFKSTDFFIKKIWFVPFFVGVVSVICFFTYKNTFLNVFLNTPITVLLSSFNLPNLIEHSSRISLVIKDWVMDSQSVRTSVLGIYPTASSAIMILTVPIVFYQFLDREKNIFYLVSITLGIIAIFLTISRISIIAFFVGIIGSYIINKRNKILISFFLILLLLLITPVLIDFFNYSLQYRSGSSINRLKLYLYGINLTNKTNILLGLGYKPRIDQFYIPIGSHSTFIGAYVKTGLIGFIAIVVWQIMVLKLWVANVSRIKETNKTLFLGIGAGIIAMTIWMLTEDIDAPQLVMFTYAVLTGLLISITKDDISTSENSSILL